MQVSSSRHALHRSCAGQRSRISISTSTHAGAAVRGARACSPRPRAAWPRRRPVQLLGQCRDPGTDATAALTVVSHKAVPQSRRHPRQPSVNIRSARCTRRSCVRPPPPQRCALLTIPDSALLRARRRSATLLVRSNKRKAPLTCRLLAPCLRQSQSLVSVSQVVSSAALTVRCAASFAAGPSLAAHPDSFACAASTRPLMPTDQRRRQTTTVRSFLAGRGGSPWLAAAVGLGRGRPVRRRPAPVRTPARWPTARMSSCPPAAARQNAGQMKDRSCQLKPASTP